jgi:putative transposase
MKRTRFTEAQIVKVLKQHEAGSKVGDLWRELGISDATFYNWKDYKADLSQIIAKCVTSFCNKSMLILLQI